MMYIRTKDGVYSLVDTYYMCVDGVETYMYDNNGRGVEIRGSQILKQSENLEELCDEFVFNSDISNYVIDKKFIELTKAIILKIYKENDETDYVKAMHPKFYGAIWTDKGLIYVAKMDNEGKLVLI